MASLPVALSWTRLDGGTKNPSDMAHDLGLCMCVCEWLSQFPRVRLHLCQADLPHPLSHVSMYRCAVGLATHVHSDHTSRCLPD